MSEKVVDISKGVIILEKQTDSGSEIKPHAKHFKKFDDLKLKILLINGPNLNMLGKRDPEIYGTFTLLDVERETYQAAFARGFNIEFFQSNYEGAIIEKIHDAMERYDGIIINPGAFTHYSYAIADAIGLTGLPCVETHISDISQREDFRKISVVSPVCIHQVKGLGIKSYTKAVGILCDYIEAHINNK